MYYEHMGHREIQCGIHIPTTSLKDFIYVALQDDVMKSLG